MAPLVVKGKVLIGDSSGEMSVRGWVTALNEEDGKIAWRAYATGPFSDVLIGPDFKPFYEELKGKDLGVKSWPADAWKHGGGTMWGWISYDPDMNLIYYGSGNPGPWNSAQRPGDNLWTTSIFARDPATGAAKWALPLNPHDVFDHDEINESILLDLTIDGKPRKVMVHVGRDGYMWMIDRATGEALSVEPYDFLNAYKGFDYKRGRLILNEEKEPTPNKTVHYICPTAPGAKDWQPSAWSPRTKLIYVPHQHLCMDWKSSEVGYIAGTPFVGATVDMYAGPGGYRGEFMAWDPVARKRVWEIHENFPVWSGTVVTAGDVAFYGAMDRWFKAVDATNGKPLWQFHAGSGIIGQPVTYQGSDPARRTSPSWRVSAAGPAPSPMPSSTRGRATGPWASPAQCRICRQSPVQAANCSCSRCPRQPLRPRPEESECASKLLSPPRRWDVAWRVSCSAPPPRSARGALGPSRDRAPPAQASCPLTATAPRRCSRCP